MKRVLLEKRVLFKGKMAQKLDGENMKQKRKTVKKIVLS